MAILELNHVSKAYGGTPVLKDITLPTTSTRRSSSPTAC